MTIDVDDGVIRDADADAGAEVGSGAAEVLDLILFGKEAEVEAEAAMLPSGLCRLVYIFLFGKTKEGENE